MHFRRTRGHPNQRHKSEKWPADRHFRFHDPRCFARVLTYTRSVGIPLVRSHRYLYARPIPVSNTVRWLGQLLPAATPLRPPDIYFPARLKSTSYFDVSRMQFEKVRSVTTDEICERVEDLFVQKFSRTRYRIFALSLYNRSNIFEIFFGEMSQITDDCKLEFNQTIYCYNMPCTIIVIKI